MPRLPIIWAALVLGILLIGLLFVPCNAGLWNYDMASRKTAQENFDALRDLKADMSLFQ